MYAVIQYMYIPPSAPNTTQGLGMLRGKGKGESGKWKGKGEMKLQTELIHN